MTCVAIGGLFLPVFVADWVFALQSALFSPDSPPSGPIISDITEVHSPMEEEEVAIDMTHAG